MRSWLTFGNLSVERELTDEIDFDDVISEFSNVINEYFRIVLPAYFCLNW